MSHRTVRCNVTIGHLFRATLVAGACMLPLVGAASCSSSPQQGSAKATASGSRYTQNSGKATQSRLAPSRSSRTDSAKSISVAQASRTKTIKMAQATHGSRSTGHGGMKGMGGMGVPGPGLHAYTMGHSKTSTPPDRLGGPLKVSINQTNGSTRLVLPGPRFMDPSVFGTPDKPVGFDPAPFPLLGVPVAMRKTSNSKFTFVDHATPFSDWYEVGVGSVHIEAVDATAIDGARTKDKIDFEATFKLPDGSAYRVVCKKVLPHGMAFPTFGGVVTNHLLHGGTGIGTRLMPTEFTYFAFWGVGDIYKDGKLINKDHMIHVMVTEIVRGEGYKLQFDGGVGDPPQGQTLHLMIPPYKPVMGKGMVSDPLKTMFMPFPYVKKHMMAAMMAAKQSHNAERVATLMEVKKMMDRTKAHVMHATAELAPSDPGKMYGMPFMHIMFGNIDMRATH